MPSLVARTVVVPGDTPVTRPFTLTVATEALPIIHATGRVTGTPFWSNRAAVYARVRPTWTSALSGITRIESTAIAITSTLTVSANAPADATTSTVPALTPVPTESTIPRTDGSSDVQKTSAVALDDVVTLARKVPLAAT